MSTSAPRFGGAFGWTTLLALFVCAPSCGSSSSNKDDIKENKASRKSTEVRNEETQLRKKFAAISRELKEKGVLGGKGLFALASPETGLHFYSLVAKDTAFTACSAFHVAELHGHFKDNGGWFSLDEGEKLQCNKDLSQCDVERTRKPGVGFLFDTTKNRRTLTMIIQTPPRGKPPSSNPSGARRYIERNRHQCRMRKLLREGARSESLWVARVVPPGAQLQTQHYKGVRAQKQLDKLLQSYRLHPKHDGDKRKWPSFSPSWRCDDLTCHLSNTETPMEITLESMSGNGIAMVAVAPESTNHTLEKAEEIRRLRAEKLIGREKQDINNRP